MEDIKFYVINYNNEIRRDKMKNRFSKLGISFEFIEGVGPTDEKLNMLKDDQKHAAPCMFSHLKSIKSFIESEYDYCIICEDDIHIKISIVDDIDKILDYFKELQLDILLLGYLINFNPRGSTGESIKNKYTYHAYGDTLWGTQMYLISKNYGKLIYDKYHNGPMGGVPFASDWTITKNGNKAFIYPMLGVEEENSNPKADYHQQKYHNDCHRFNYNNQYI